MSTTPAPFDINSYMETANKAEKENKPNDYFEKQAEAVKPPVVEKPKEPEVPLEDDIDGTGDELESPKLDKDGKPVHPGRSDRDRRYERKLVKEREDARVEAALAKGRADAMEAMLRDLGVDPASRAGKAATAAAKSDEQPKREDFPAGDAGTGAFAGAMGAWSARQFHAAKSNDDAARDALKAQMDLSNEAWQEESELIPDWQAMNEKISKDTRFDLPDGKLGNLRLLLLTSTLRGHVVEYLFKNIDQLEALKKAENNPLEQQKLFSRIEGRAEVVYDSRKEQKMKLAEEAAKGSDPSKGQSPTVGERDAAKAAPSAAVGPKGGVPSNDEEVQPTVTVNGRVEINPAWYEQQNKREGRRR